MTPATFPFILCALESETLVSVTVREAEQSELQQVTATITTETGEKPYLVMFLLDDNNKAFVSPGQSHDVCTSRASGSLCTYMFSLNLGSGQHRESNIPLRTI